VQLDVDRFLALVCRELGAEEAQLLDPDQTAVAAADDGRELRCPMVDGRSVVVRFGVAPADLEAKQRRLEILTSTFDAVVEESSSPERKSRPPVARSLQAELETLCARAAAINAFVIDANSPVVWGAARPDRVVVRLPLPSNPPNAQVPPESQGDVRVALASRRALQAVRALPEIAALHKGKHVRHLRSSGEPPLLARSFAGIYLLVVVFEGPFDELRAERATLESLPRIERFVLALPPLDPSPDTGAGVVAMRRPRRR
jgi:hypothetical protein